MNTLMMTGFVIVFAFSTLLILFACRRSLTLGEFQPFSDAFVRRWPAIDDDEFVRRCSPGTPYETALKVRRIVAEQLDVPYDHVYPEQSFVNDLGCD